VIRSFTNADQQIEVELQQDFTKKALGGKGLKQSIAMVINDVDAM
jgi:hypothetical protein